jgi:hypothetical protein
MNDGTNPGLYKRSPWKERLLQGMSIAWVGSGNPDEK